MISVRKSTLLKSLSCILIVCGLFSACVKTPDPVPATVLQSLYATLSASSNYSIITAAIVKAGLSDSLTNGKGPYTIFAPTDAAFAVFGINTAADLSKFSSDSIKKIVSYHLLNYYLPTTTTPTGPDSARTTAGGFPVYFTALTAYNGSQYLYINGNIISPPGNFLCKNGVIQLIGGILNPPLANITLTVPNVPTLSLFNAAIKHSGVNAALSGTTKYTVFAPSDSAFHAAGYANIAAINAADSTTLARLLNYHIIPGFKFASDLVDGSSVQTVQGENIKFNTEGAILILGATNTTASTVTQGNISASNGVVYIINQLLKP